MTFGLAIPWVVLACPMLIYVGLHLDGMQPHLPVTAVDEATLGPARFVDVREK